MQREVKKYLFDIKSCIQTSKKFNASTSSRKKY